MNNTRTIEVEGRGAVWSLVFLEDGKSFLSGGEDGMIRQWRVEDGREVGQPYRTSSGVQTIAASGDRKWIVTGEERMATVWNRITHQSSFTVDEHTGWVRSVDISPDSTRFATGATDNNVFIWDIETGIRLIGPLRHDKHVVAVKFSPDGNYVATVSLCRELRIYNADNGELLRAIPVKAHSTNPIAWSSDSRRIFIITSDAAVRQLYVETGTFISEWTVPGDLENSFISIALPRNGRFIASFVGRSLSLWDTSNSERFGPVFDHPRNPRLWSIALSSDNNYIATGGENGVITLRNLNNIIPMYYLGRQNVQQPQQSGIDSIRNEIRALEARIELTRVVTLSNSRAQSQASASSYIPDGGFQIKSSVTDLYLTCPQDEDSMVYLQKSDPFSNSQKWWISHVADGTYSIVGHRGNSAVPLCTGDGNELICDSEGEHTTWTIEPRGETYVIGNTANATVMHFTQRPLHVSAFLRNNTQNQRWVLERV